jgi:hypothetical protein
MTTDRKCEMCPFRRDCPDCPWSGEIPAAATVSDARTGAADVTIRGTKTAPGGASTPLVQGPRPSDHAEGLSP